MNNKRESDYVVIPSPGTKYIQGEIVNEDEISLLDFWRILVKRRKLLYGTLIAVIAAVAIWIFISKPVYESRTVLVIGKIVPGGQLESTQTLMQRLRETYNVNDSSEGARELPLVKNVDLVNKSNPDAIEISAVGYSAAQSQSFLKGVVEKILTEHKHLYEIGVSEQNKLLNSLQSHRQEMEAALLESKKQISQAHIDPSMSGLLALEMDKLSSQLLDIDQKESQLRLSMSELQSYETEVIRQPTLPARSVKPKPTLYLAIAVVIGLITGIIIVCIAEFLEKVRTEDSKKSSDIAVS